ncbi:nitrate reductase molybdenum cofactor assembly chaperone [Nocardiopsis kunsanensis]|uniref:Nitrate reductase molybdenum cofactor assembly chaperone n=1 Tax=Nocardiopsis kunsanensis TaxID=141693 RepID=A0A918XC24_9ACTN|nr:nitrate reductase molybdenum cofactor assembly chaperone [Nocardiopsis kunsanensis]
MHVSTTTDSGGRPGWLGAGRAARSAHRRAVTRQAASVLLGYPDEVFFERLPLAARAAAELPSGNVRTALMEFCEHASSTPESELCRHYAEVFDIHRRHALRMTYYTDGHGPALSDVRSAYTDAGWQVPTRELPDHLAVLLEFSARGGSEAGHDLLLRFRPGLELLGAALREHGTPYARVLDAVSLTLPSPGEQPAGGAVRHMDAQGPNDGEGAPEGNGECTPQRVAEAAEGRVPAPREPQPERREDLDGDRR